MTRRARLRDLFFQLTREAPLAQVFAALRLAQPFVSVDGLAVKRVAEQLFGLRGPTLRDFCRRSWWAEQANLALRARLAWNQAEVHGLCELPDFSRIQALVRAGRGVVLAAAHLGAMSAAASLVHVHFPRTLFLLDHPWSRPGGPRVITVQQRQQRLTALLQARDHLRGGGLVWLAPEGTAAPNPIRVQLRGRTLSMGRGAAALARTTGAASVPIAARWVGERLAFLTGEAIEPRVTGDAEAWERQWVQSYLAAADAWIAGVPENLPPYGGIYMGLRA
jgi:lauroyl/myristoyl acyltransferase